jgi:hypothetical protein
MPSAVLRMIESVAINVFPGLWGVVPAQPQT